MCTHGVQSSAPGVIKTPPTDREAPPFLSHHFLKSPPCAIHSQPFPATLFLPPPAPVLTQEMDGTPWKSDLFPTLHPSGKGVCKIAWMGEGGGGILQIYNLSHSKRADEIPAPPPPPPRPVATAQVFLLVQRAAGIVCRHPSTARCDELLNSCKSRSGAAKTL